MVRGGRGGGGVNAGGSAGRGWVANGAQVGGNGRSGRRERGSGRRVATPAVGELAAAREHRRIPQPPLELFARCWERARWLSGDGRGPGWGQKSAADVGSDAHAGAVWCAAWTRQPTPDSNGVMNSTGLPWASASEYLKPTWLTLSPSA